MQWIRVSQLGRRGALVSILTLACGEKPTDVGVSGAGTGVTDTSGETDGPPQGCPDFEFPGFEAPYGELYCEVYIGCFGEAGGREPGDPVATTISDCLAITCGNGDVNLENESACTYDEAQGADCLAAMMAIADDLTQCPNVDDAWFPDACGLAIECSLP